MKPFFSDHNGTAVFVIGYSYHVDFIREILTCVDNTSSNSIIERIESYKRIDEIREEYTVDR